MFLKQHIFMQYNIFTVVQDVLFDVFELFIFMWFCKVWVVGQQVDHIGNDVLRKEGDKFFWKKRVERNVYLWLR